MNHSLLDQPQVLRALFHPRWEYPQGASAPSIRVVTVEVEPGIAVGGRLYLAAPESPTILYFHGNGEIAADYAGLAPLYTGLGVSLLVVDYRGYGRSDGTPTASHLLSDALTTYQGARQILAENGLSPSRFYVMGRSLGSAAAIEVALHAGEALDGLIVESGFADTFGLLARLGTWIQGASEEQDGFGNAAKLERITTRTLIIHGRDDALIPAADGQELYRRCAAADKRLVLIPRAGHNDLMMVGMAPYFEAIRSFVHVER